MNEKQKKRQVIKISVFITSIFVIFLSVTYAFINLTLQGTKKQVITAGNLELDLIEDENNITLTNALPMYDEVGMIQEPFTFRLKNKGTTDVNYTLKLVDITTGTAEDKLQTSDVKYYLTKDGTGSPALLSTLTDGQVDSGTIAGNQTIEYTLRLWIDASVTENSRISGKSLSYRIDVEVSQEKEVLSFTDQLENIAQESTSTFPDFSKISSPTNGRGIYKYKEDGVDIYYWRGDVDAAEGSANHVIFAGYCWEIVRTTKTGGIKMIYDGEPVVIDEVKTCPNTGTASQLTSTSKFNSKYNDNAYVGYMYGLTGVSAELSSPQCIKKNSAGTSAEVGTETTETECEQAGGKWATTAYEATHANVVNSTIKETIDTWFSTSRLNTKENLEKIEDAVYCNDRSIDTSYGTGLGYRINQTGYNARNRLVTNKTPRLECTNENDRFTVREENGNGELTYPVGLLTADEIALAGGVYNVSNSDYYLTTGQYYWALSPYYFNGGYAYEFYVLSFGRLNDYYVYDAYGVRPVVSLAAGTEITGIGTEESPFEVK